jgi:ATP-dependent helicase/nuclease subunit A
LFNERVDLARTGTPDELHAEILRLESLGWFTREGAESLDLDGLAGFWSSPLADSLRAHAEFVERELPFTARLRIADARRLGSSQSPSGFAPDDYQVVQGVIDLALILPDEIWIVDFKTDRVSPDTLAQRAEEYGPQLRLYAHALTEIYRRPVTQRWLYFFATRDLVPIAAV